MHFERGSEQTAVRHLFHLYSLTIVIFLDYACYVVDIPDLVIDDSVWEQMVSLVTNSLAPFEKLE